MSTPNPIPTRSTATARRAIGKYVDAGYDRVYVSQIGEDQAGFLDFFVKFRPHL